MPDSHPFAGWFARVRALDPAAVAELVTAVSPLLRRVVRGRLARHGLGWVMDPDDICQATFGRFFARVAAGWWPAVGSPADLRAVLAAIARNLTRDEAKRHTAGRRDRRRDVCPAGVGGLAGVAGRGPSPVQVLACRELCVRAVGHLTAAEHELVEDRLAGRAWDDIAADRGRPAAVLRQQYHRAVSRVRRLMAAEAEGGF